MITAYTVQEGRMLAQVISHKGQLMSDAVWLDLEQPSEEELAWIREVYQQALPDMDELVEIEATSRFFQDDSGLHVRAYFLHEVAERTNNVTVAFILNQGRLFTLRDEALITFEQYRHKLEAQSVPSVDAYGICWDCLN